MSGHDARRSILESLETRRLLAGISGVVTDTSTHPQFNRAVYLDLNNNGGNDSGQEPTAMTDGNGAYSFTDLAEGTYHVRITLPPSLTTGSPAEGEYVRTLQAGENSTGNDFVLTHAYAQPRPDPNATLDTAINLGVIRWSQIIDDFYALDSDREMFRFGALGGSTIDFDIVSEGDHFLMLFDAQGNPLTAWTGGGAREHVSHTFSSTGTYYVGVSTSRNTAYDPTIPGGSVGWNSGYLGDYALRLTPTLRISGDFDNDGKADLVLHDTQTGQTRLWLMNGAQLKSEVDLPTPGDKNWRLVAVADFNADGESDLLWQNQVIRRNSVWLMNGTSVTQYRGLAYATNPDWQLGGAADFDGDDQPDLVWQNIRDGRCTLWLMNGTQIKGFKGFAKIARPDYRIAAVQDFNGVDAADLVWYLPGTDNDPMIWHMNLTRSGGFVPIFNRVGPTDILHGHFNVNGSDSRYLLMRSSNSVKLSALRVRSGDYWDKAIQPLPDLPGPDWEVIG